MEDLSKKISEILQDPIRMQQIMELSSNFGVNPEPESENANTEPPIIQEALRQVSQVLHQTEAKEKRQQTLVRALLPYLSPKRQTKLEQAMQIARLSRIAGAALQKQPSAISLPQEEDFHV